MSIQVGIVGSGRNIISDLRLAACKAKMMEYTVIMGNQCTLDKLKVLNQDEKIIYVQSPLEDKQLIAVIDEKLKYSILSGKKIIDKCPEMEQIAFSMHG